MCKTWVKPSTVFRFLRINISWDVARIHGYTCDKQVWIICLILVMSEILGYSNLILFFMPRSYTNHWRLKFYNKRTHFKLKLSTYSPCFSRVLYFPYAVENPPWSVYLILKSCWKFNSLPQSLACRVEFIIIDAGSHIIRLWIFQDLRSQTKHRNINLSKKRWM